MTFNPGAQSSTWLISGAWLINSLYHKTCRCWKSMRSVVLLVFINTFCKIRCSTLENWLQRGYMTYIILGYERLLTVLHIYCQHHTHIFNLLSSAHCIVTTSRSTKRNFHIIWILRQTILLVRRTSTSERVQHQNFTCIEFNAY